ncbi:Dolichyl-diphosphooligosaccharide--protein glycosyltransferase 48 kDa subunit [Linum perenne]
MAKLAIFFSLTLSLLPFLSLSFSPESPSDRRILVLLDDFSLKSSHSIYFTSLKSRGFDLEFKLADDPKLALQTVDSSASDLIKNIATECGVDFDEVCVDYLTESFFLLFCWL